MSNPSRSKGGGSSRHQSFRSFHGGQRHNNNSFNSDENRHPTSNKDSHFNGPPYSNEGPPSLKRPRVDIPFGKRIQGPPGPPRHDYGHFVSRSRSPPPPRHSSSHYYSGPSMHSSSSSSSSDPHHGNDRRMERDTRSLSSFSRGPNGHRGGPTGSSEKGSLNTNAVTKQRIYSDFRIARVKIGSFEVVEDNSSFSSHSYNSHNGLKDSRLRLYFRGSGSDKQYATNYVLSENSTARDRALTEPDRLSISIYNGTKRIVIPVQDGLEKVQFRRSDGYFRIQSKSWALFEELDFPHHSSRGGHSRHSSSVGHFRKCDDITNGQLEAANGLIEVWTDMKHPLPVEPKWVYGNLSDYIDSRSKFLQHKVLEVLDPELIIDFDSLVDLWTKQCTISSLAEREDFVKTKLSQLPYILELCSKMLAPPHYYVSKALVASSSGRNGNHSSLPTTKPDILDATSALESSQIPALISPSVNALLASFTYIAKRNANLPDAELISMLKTIMYQVPEPVLWRALDGLFSKRAESELSFDAETVMKKLPEKTNQKATQIKEARLSTEAIENGTVDTKSGNNSTSNFEDNSEDKIEDENFDNQARNDSKKKANEDKDEDEIMDNADEYIYDESLE